MQACRAFLSDVTGLFPVKSKKTNLRIRHFTYFIIINNSNILLRKRGETDIWANLYEPALTETEKQLVPGSVQMKKIARSIGIQNPARTEFLGNMRQKLTHQLIEFSFFLYKDASGKLDNIGEYKYVPLAEISKYALPKSVSIILSKNIY